MRPNSNPTDRRVSVGFGWSDDGMGASRSAMVDGCPSSALECASTTVDDKIGGRVG